MYVSFAIQIMLRIYSFTVRFAVMKDRRSKYQLVKTRFLKDK